MVLDQNLNNPASNVQSCNALINKVLKIISSIKTIMLSVESDSNYFFLFVFSANMFQNDIIGLFLLEHAVWHKEVF